MTGAEAGSVRKVQIKDIVKIYKDPETEKYLEGYAFVWAILEEDAMFYTLMVSFQGDPHERRVPRKYRKEAGT